MRVDILTKEYPPAVYGGAGVHVAELVRALRGLDGLDARVRAFGAPREEPGTSGYPDLAELAGANAALATLGVRRFFEPGYRHGRRAGGGALLVGVPAGLQSSPALTATGCSDS